MSKLQPTAEQAQIIEHTRQGESCKVIAYAGSGKTTTLQLISEQLVNKKGLYIAFNKPIATHAKTKFAKHVDCRTFHSLAFAQTDARITQKLSYPRLSPHKLAAYYGLSALPIRRLIDKRYERYSLAANRQAAIIGNALSVFCRSYAAFPAERHIELPSWVHPLDAQMLQKTLLPKLQQRWLDAVTPAHELAISHDIYLKLWALSKPVIASDFIMFDEAQDSDPIMLGVLLAQQSQVIYVGDPHQQIYAWRGAVNAMEKLPLSPLRLTQSFRFGEPIAAVANVFLGALGEFNALRGNPNVRSSVVHSKAYAKQNAVLCRTNVRAMELLLEGVAKGHKVALLADVERINRFVEAAAQLKQGKKPNNEPDLAWFNSWQDLQEYCETAEGSDLKSMVRLVDDYGSERVAKGLQRAVSEKNADYVISTTHKAKGLEWAHVHIEDDYSYKLLQKEALISDDELRLLYVACSRAQHGLNTYHLAALIDKLCAPKKATVNRQS